VFTIPQPDSCLSATDVKELAENFVEQLPRPGIEGSTLDPGEIWAVVTLAVNQTSVWETCKDNDKAPCDDTVMDWLHTLNREWIKRIANDLLNEMAMTILDPDRSRIVSIDFVDNPYRGMYADESGELCRMAAKDGTTTCHRYCSAYLVLNGKPVTLAMTYVRSDESEADTVEIDPLLADHGFYNECILLRSSDIAATVVPIQKKGKHMKRKLDTHCSYMTTYRMCRDCKRESQFPLAVAVSYQAGDRGKSGEVVRGYVAYNLADRTPKQVERLYRKRSAIETSYRVFRQAQVVTTTQDPIVRFAFVLVRFLLENLWLVLRGAGATCLKSSRSKRSLIGIERSWEVKMNGVGVTQAYAPATS